MLRPKEKQAYEGAVRRWQAASTLKPKRRHVALAVEEEPEEEDFEEEDSEEEMEELKEEIMERDAQGTDIQTENIQEERVAIPKNMIQKRYLPTFQRCDKETISLTWELTSTSTINCRRMIFVEVDLPDPTVGPPTILCCPSQLFKRQTKF